MLLTDKGGMDFEPIPAGTHAAHCNSVIDLGTQHWVSGMYGPKTARKFRIGFELPGVTRIYDEDKGPEPSIVGEEFTASLDERSNLRKFLESWIGKAFTAEELGGFDPKTLIGKTALLNLVHGKGKNGKTYANIATAMPLPKSMREEAGQPTLPTIHFDLENFSEAAYDKLPEWIRKKIALSDEWAALHDTSQQPDASRTTRDAVNGEQAMDDDEDTIPF